VKASSTARGYGQAHRTARRKAIATYKPTDPCVRCGVPLGDDSTSLHLDHNDDRTGYLGLAHGTCNSSAGAASGHAQRRGVYVPTPSRDW
jgi:hypothetical protein